MGAATPPRWPTSSAIGRGLQFATWRKRSAIPPDQQDAWSKQIDSWGTLPISETDRWQRGDRQPAASCMDHHIPDQVVDLAEQLLKAPRHLGIHSGGMVLTERPVGEVCPIERGRMDNRTVLQWDKDSCAWMGLVKFDFLGLGILAAIQYTFDLVATSMGERWTLDTMPKEEAGVYDMLCRADSIGVFQVESRAQVGTLPRLLPRRFYDLVIEVALIRPGPIQGGAVHPYIRRATGREEVTYLHPALEPVLERTKGVPLFQEQLCRSRWRLAAAPAMMPTCCVGPWGPSVAWRRSNGSRTSSMRGWHPTGLPVP